jgi:hypothetical protein
VSKQTGKGSRSARRASAIERKATQHHEFIGDSDAERAEAEFRKRERVDAEQTREVVREMASELEAAAGVTPGDGAIGPEFPFRIPRSVEEARDMVREAPDRLREKARERLDRLPEPAQKALHVAEAAAAVLLIPVRAGLWLAREVVRLPFGVFRALREREA